MGNKFCKLDNDVLTDNNFQPLTEKKHIITHICFDDLIGDKEVFKKSRDSGLIKVY